jgi:hypothetical protein
MSTSFISPNQQATLTNHDFRRERQSYNDMLEGTAVVRALALALASARLSVLFIEQQRPPSSLQHCTFRKRAPNRPISHGLRRASVWYLINRSYTASFSLSPKHVITTRHDHQQRSRRGTKCTQCNPHHPTALGKHAPFVNYHAA